MRVGERIPALNFTTTNPQLWKSFRGELMLTAEQNQENRLTIFANVFKGYMGVMPLVTAALAPLLTAIGAIPVYESLRKPLSTLSGILGFLLLAWVFYVRRTIALGSITRGWRATINLLPLLLIVASIWCYVDYTLVLDNSVDLILRAIAARVSVPPSRSEILKTWGSDNSIPNSGHLQLFYLGMFLFAESAFVLMAIREYINDVRQITEKEWMFGDQSATGKPITLPKEQSVNVVGSS